MTFLFFFFAFSLFSGSCAFSFSNSAGGVPFSVGTSSEQEQIFEANVVSVCAPYVKGPKNGIFNMGKVSAPKLDRSGEAFGQYSLTVAVDLSACHKMLTPIHFWITNSNACGTTGSGSYVPLVVAEADVGRKLLQKCDDGSLVLFFKIKSDPNIRCIKNKNYPLMNIYKTNSTSDACTISSADTGKKFNITFYPGVAIYGYDKSRTYDISYGSYRASGFVISFSE